MALRFQDGRDELPERLAAIERGPKRSNTRERKITKGRKGLLREHKIANPRFPIDRLRIALSKSFA